MAGAIADGEFWPRVVDLASRAYRDADGHARRFARAKLGNDRVFRHLIEHGLVAPTERVLDLGCGQGLLASALQAAQTLARQGHWPADWAPAPRAARVTGIDPLAHDIERATRALGDGASFRVGDMRTAPLPTSDVIAFLDTLHYLQPDEQDAVLARAGAALADGGRMLLRVHDADAPLRHAFGLAVDRVTMLLHGGGFGRVHGRTLAGWCAPLQRLGLQVESIPMNGRRPFANRLIVARRSPH